MYIPPTSEHGPQWTLSPENKAEPQVEIEDDSSAINFYGPVTHRSTHKLTSKLRKLEKEHLTAAIRYDIEPPPIHIHIHSFGGSLYAGWAAMGVVSQCQVPVHTHIEGAAASAATSMSIAGDHRTMQRSSHMLIHQLSTGFWGKYEELKDKMDNADNQMEEIRNVYRRYAEVPEDVLQDILCHDLWWDAETCLAYELVDEVL